MATAVAKSRPTETTRNPLMTLRREMEDLLTRFWDGSSYEILNEAFAPTLDLSETDNMYELRVDIPGMQAKDFDVRVHGNSVTISGLREQEKTEKGRTYHRMERRSGSFSRSISLPTAVKEDEVAADYTNGVLTVVLPKNEQERARRIAVKA